MSTQKRLSHLSIAAAALLTVAVPSFAQTKSADANTDLTTSRQVVAFNTEHITNPFDSLNRTSENVAVTSAAPAQPKLSASQFSVNDNQLGFTKSQSKAYEIRFDDSNSQVSANSNGESSSKGMSFVPSRGPKFPWQAN
jgi:hypothetical protein